MKHKQLSHRAELVFELQGWTILNGTQGEYINLDKAPVEFLAAAILMEAHLYGRRMEQQGRQSSTGLVINQYKMN